MLFHGLLCISHIYRHLNSPSQGCCNVSETVQVTSTDTIFLTAPLEMHVLSALSGIQLTMLTQLLDWGGRINKIDYLFSWVEKEISPG